MKLAAQRAFVLLPILLILHFSLATNGTKFYDDPKNNNFATTNQRNNPPNKIKSKLLTTNDIFQSNHQDQDDNEGERFHQAIDDASFNFFAPRSSAPLSSQKSSKLNPVILVPGDGGSRIQAKLDRQTSAHVYCERKSNDWFDLWLNLSLLVPFALDCWVEK